MTMEKSGMGLNLFRPVYNTFLTLNNNSAGQAARMHRMVCAFVVSHATMSSFLAKRPNYNKG